MKNTTAQNQEIENDIKKRIIRMARAGKAVDASLMDILNIGTPNYLGIAYFWSHEYKHSLREFTCAQRCKVHNAFIKAGLALDGVSDKHYAIICKFNKNICQV